ncbi:MAG: dienelactone hydrolase family protein [Alphaproteobacteria bacterium]|nr:dienelactone hydrolase family protein [Alphaproteobacteria bacterium]
MGRDLTLTASDGFTFDAYKAVPAGKTRGAVVVVQEIFGVNAHIRETVDLFADLGFAAIAPALFDRAQKKVSLGYTPEDIAKGREYVPKIDWAKVILDVEAAAKDGAPHGKVGIVGYCWGGTVAWLAACRAKGIAASSSYYGGGVANFASEKAKCPTILHFGDKDKAIPIEAVEQVRKAQPSCPVYRYPLGDHGFNCDHRGTFHALSALVALGRTVQHFGQHLG